MAGFDPGFSTDGMARLFSSAGRVEMMCRVEAALARAEEAVGVIPAGMAEAIGQACSDPVSDPEKVLRDGWVAGSPVIVLLDRLRQRVSPEASDWLHHGATTQDIVDTSTVLLMRDGFEIVGGDLRLIGIDLRRIAEEHRGTPTTARTLLQDAGPTTFGYRVARWLDPFTKHLLDVKAASAKLPVQLGGPNGNPTALGDKAIAVAELLAVDLGLVAPRLPWHAERTPIAEAIAVVEAVARTVRKVATDLTLLAQSAIAEVRMRPGASSSMPWKTNPVDAVRALAAAEVCLATAGLVLRGQPHELERGAGAWHTEWFAIPVAFQACAASVEALATAVQSLEVLPERMAANLGAMPDDSVITTAGVFIDRVLRAADEAIEAPSR